MRRCAHVRLHVWAGVRVSVDIRAYARVCVCVLVFWCIRVIAVVCSCLRLRVWVHMSKHTSTLKDNRNDIC